LVLLSGAGGIPVRGVGQAATWDSGTSTLQVRIRSGVVWVDVSLPPDLLIGKDPQTLAIQVFRLASPRLP
jgi:hypothetical protein